MKIKKFESFEESLEDLESDVELLMQGLIESLNLKRFEDGPDVEPDDPVNGYFSYGTNKTDLRTQRGGAFIAYLFITEDPFDTESSSSTTLNNTITKVKFIQSLLEEISKVTNRLDRFEYKWQLIHYSGDNQLGLYIYSKSSKPEETEAQIGECLESFSSESSDLVNHINYDKFEDLLSNNKVEEITDGEIDKIKYLIDLVEPSIGYEKLKRFRSDEFESCVSFDMKYDRNNVGYIIFYKFEDGWWMIEMCTNHQSSRHARSERQRKVQTWIVDSLDGVKKWTETILASI